MEYIDFRTHDLYIIQLTLHIHYVSYIEYTAY